MGESLAISSLILAVLDSVRAISSFIEDIKNAPYQVSFLRSDLEALRPALDQLSEIISRPEQNEIPVAHHLSPALEQCKEAAQLFQESLGRWTKRLGDGKLAWIDRVGIATRHQRQIDAFQKQLAACKQSLTLSITATCLSQSLSKTPSPRDEDYLSQVEVLERNATESGNFYRTDMTRIDDQIRDLTRARPAESGSISQDQPDNAVRQLQLYKAAAEHFHRLCSESIPKTVTEAKLQRIRNVQTSTDGVAHVGAFNERAGAEKISQDIQDITTDSRGFVIVGTANGIDFNQMYASMRK